MASIFVQLKNSIANLYFIIYYLWLNIYVSLLQYIVKYNYETIVHYLIMSILCILYPYSPLNPAWNTINIKFNWHMFK